MLVAIRDDMAKPKKAGKVARRARGRKTNRSFRREVGQYVIEADYFTRRVYEGVYRVTQ